MAEKIQSIPARLKNIAKGGHVAGTEDIIDDNLNKTQNVINTETNSKFVQLDNEIEGLEKQDVVPVDTLPDVSSADTKKIYRVVGEDSYTDYMVNASGDGWKTLATYGFPGIDDEPTAGSDNLVKSGGVKIIDDKIGYSVNGIINLPANHTGNLSHMLEIPIDNTKGLYITANFVGITRGYRFWYKFIDDTYSNVQNITSYEFIPNDIPSDVVAVSFGLYNGADSSGIDLSYITDSNGNVIGGDVSFNVTNNIAAFIKTLQNKVVSIPDIIKERNNINLNNISELKWTVNTDERYEFKQRYTELANKAYYLEFSIDSVLERNISLVIDRGGNASTLTITAGALSKFVYVFPTNDADVEIYVRYNGSDSTNCTVKVKSANIINLGSLIDYLPVHQGYINGSDKWADIDTGTRWYTVWPIDEKLVGANVSVSNAIEHGGAAVVKFLSSYNPISGEEAGVVGSVDGSAVIPSAAKFLYILINSGGNLGQANSNRLPSSLKINDIDIALPVYDLLKDIINTAATAASDTQSSLYKIIGNENEVELKLKNLSLCDMAYNGLNNSNGDKLISILHFSDNHDCEDNMANLIEFLDRFDGYIDGCINTGDLTGLTNEVMPKNYSTYAPKTMLAIGNHDAVGQRVDGVGYISSSAVTYTKYIKDYALDWGITPNIDKCYYYKDFTSKITGVNGVRLIVLDNYNTSLNLEETYAQVKAKAQTEQIAWLNSVLQDAITNNLSVICCQHEQVGEHKGVYKTPFNDKDDYTTAYDTRFVNSVSTFIDNGGDFICWLTGHAHRDDFDVIIADDRQLDFNIACMGYRLLTTTEGALLKDTSSQMCFNVLGVDTQRKQLKIQRFGRNSNRYLVQKNTIVVNYLTKDIISYN